MFYVIQENVFREEGYDALTRTLERLQLDWEVVKVLPFVENFEVQTKRRDVFVFGSLKMVRLAKKFDWVPGVLVNANHHFFVYRNHYREHLLNWDSELRKFRDDWKWEKQAYFIRPCADTKDFNGQVFDEDGWREFQQRKLTDGHTSSLSSLTPIQVASVKKIQKEYRFWVVGGEIVTGSLYKLGTQVVQSGAIDPAAREFCEKMVKVFQLADAFVMDVCMVDDEWKIVECGCVNCAGFYKANMGRLIMALEDHFNRYYEAWKVIEEAKRKALGLEGGGHRGRR